MAVLIPYPKVPHTLPDILSSEEVMALLAALGSLKYSAVVTTMYAAGLRISEASALTPGDIDSQRILIHVRLGKRGRDRSVILSQKLLELPRVYWTMARPPGIYLFMGLTQRGHVGPEAVRHALREAARRVGLYKRVTPQVLRHSFATYLLKHGDLRPSRSCSGIAACTQRRATPTSRSVTFVPPPVSWTARRLARSCSGLGIGPRPSLGEGGRYLPCARRGISAAPSHVRQAEQGPACHPAVPDCGADGLSYRTHRTGKRKAGSVDDKQETAS